MNNGCTVCGFDLDERGSLGFGGESPLCRDCFAGSVASMLTDWDLDEIAYDKAFTVNMDRGYEDADCVLNGGRLPY
jgi:hypothetical protein